MADQRPANLTVEQLAEEMRSSIEGPASAVEGRMLTEAASPAACASYRRVERLQFTFVAIFQTLVAILGLFALLLLGLAAYLVFKTESKQFEAVISGAGALVASGGATFLLKLRQDARKELRAAQNNLNRGHCS